MRGLSVGNFYSCNQIPTFAQVETLQQWDEQIVLAVNGLHTAWLDTAMIVTTQTGFWTPLFLLIIIVLFKKYPAAGAWIVLAGVALTILLKRQSYLNELIEKQNKKCWALINLTNFIFKNCESSSNNLIHIVILILC